jgi:hypothetical protein
MGKVVAEATVSLDGYVAGPNESGFEHLFAWFAGGDFEFPSSDPDFGPADRARLSIHARRRRLRARAALVRRAVLR